MSHNFTLSNQVLPALSRAEFVQVFMDGLSAQAGLSCRALDHPHWVLAVAFEGRSPQSVGQCCVEALAQLRRAQWDGAATDPPHILALGGVKTTPATDDSPDSLQLGDWGVDMVETLEPVRFLQGIQWESLSAAKSADALFKIEAQL